MVNPFQSSFPPFPNLDTIKVHFEKLNNNIRPIKMSVPVNAGLIFMICLCVNMKRPNKYYSIQSAFPLDLSYFTDICLWWIINHLSPEEMTVR